VKLASLPLRAQASQANLLAVACALVAGCVLASAALAAEPDSAKAALKREMAVCESGASNQARSVCVREAQAAYAQNRRGGLDAGDADYQRNARLRCEALKGDDRLACDTRMQGGGKVSGSVADGGVYRELTTRTTGPMTAASAPVSPAPKP
jgi:hypothetical protein